MVLLEECIGLSGLTDDEIAVIAEHECVPAIVAAALGHQLLHTPKGVYRLKRLISDMLERAKLAGDQDRARHLDQVLTAFNKAHPIPRVL